LKQLGWKVFPGFANFLLCQLPPNQPLVRDLVDACRKQKLYLRDGTSMGKRFHEHTLRIAIKDKQTNLKTLQILRGVLAKAGVKSI
jgi:histidinol-phosphate/aromatic aminotransferase/cobyric acid decarboxylase-like protein